MKRIALALLTCSLAASAQADTYIQRLTQPDKISHYAGGATVAAAVSILTPGKYAAEVGLGATVLVAVGKEYYDSKHTDKHKVERDDAVATILGGALVYAALKTDRWSVLRKDGVTVLNYKVE